MSIVRAIREWLWRAVVLQQDERHPVVWYDAEVGAFLSGDQTAPGGAVKGSSAASAGLAAATCVRELALIFEVSDGAYVQGCIVIGLQWG